MLQAILLDVHDAGSGIVGVVVVVGSILPEGGTILPATGIGRGWTGGHHKGGVDEVEVIVRLASGGESGGGCP